MNSKITEGMIKAYRLCHHELEGKTYEEAAEIMGVTVAWVRELLNDMRKVAPQLFPLLTPNQVLLWDMWLAGYSCEAIARVVGKTHRSVKQKIERLKKKMDYWVTPGEVSDNIVNFDRIDETKIRQRF